MLPERRRSRQVRKIVNIVVALAASAALLTVLSAGVGVIPGLGAALDPGHGAWASASGGKLPRSQTLHLPGLARPVRVSFTSQGIASISAASDGDLFLALGYVHAKFRLTQMDLERRLGEGRLAELAGPGAVASDKFELQLGLLRTAQREWADTPRSSPAGRALTAYARGVNDYLGQVRASRQWPAAFSLAGVYPRDWTPVDSLVIQGDLTQALDFTTTPLDYSLLERALGARTTMAWFPVNGPGPQRPFDPGPYRYRGIAPLVTNGSLAPAGAGSGGAGGRHGGTGDGHAVAGTGPAAPTGARGTAAPVSAQSSARAASAILAAVRSLPSPLQVHEYPASNAWAANGPKVASGGAMLAGDPHLPQTLPSVWYQVALSAPGLAVSGVSTPGLPGVLLGHNKDIAWSLTDTQNQSAMFYDEQTSKDHPGEYFWRGQWRRMQRVHYTIPVRGGAARQLTVNITAHGPVMTTAGQTVSVDWMGAVPSPDLAVLLNISRARSFAQFRAALASWRAPTENFVYADRRGHIGAIAAGYFPVVRHGDPWLPMPGTGADDVAGVIPYRAVPQVYDPPGHVVVTANQRPVGRSYPYYIGTSANAFDPGYRAAAEYRYLSRRSSMRPSSFTGLQQSVSDDLARQVVPRLVAALRGSQLTTEQQEARGLLATWDYSMDEQSASASLWWTFWTDYLSAVFQPWWTAKKVPVHQDRFGLELGPGQFSLDEVLASWTLHDPGNPAFSPPGSGHRRNAAAVMRTAFASAVTELHGQLGGGAASWSWGRLHRTKLNSLIPGAALGYGPRASGGDPWTPDATYGGLTSSAGATWRMVVSWPGSGSGSGSGGPAGVASFPGGQSENPASPWYDNLVGGWWAGRYQPMPVAGTAAAGAGGASGAAAGGSAGAIRWELLP
jgi:penicillin amidase